MTRGLNAKPWAAALTIAALLLSVAVAFTTGCGGVPPAVHKVVILGVDGMDWQIVDPLLEQGKLPNIAALIDRGVRADFRSLEPVMKSPVIWTTIATGKGPQKHGIADFLRNTDQAPLYNSNGWLARPIWDILSEEGYTTGVINWLVTWPAQPLNGYMITERILYRPEDGFEPQERSTYPEELAEELAPYARPLSDVDVEELAPLLRGTKWRDAPTASLESAVLSLRDIYGNDETIRGVAKYMLDSREQPDFFAVYLSGVDMASHFFWGPMDPSTVDIQMDPEMVEACSEVIPRYYERMDGILGELLARLDEDSTIILCSDHGFRGPYRTPRGIKLGIWMHRPTGVFVAAGPGINAGAELSDASVFDVTPTVLALMDQPVARDMDGFVLEDALSPDLLRRNPVDYIDTYETSSYAPRGEEGAEEPNPTAVDDEIKERLKSLGYIE